jgi:thiamine-phosphate pyrophosphorylase
MTRNLADQLRLMLITDQRTEGAEQLLGRCRAAVRGGVTAVQLRCKGAPDRELLALARALIAELPVPVLVNDRPDIAIAAGAWGVHLGPDDLEPRLARRAGGPSLVIGASVGMEAEAPRGSAADYWGVGPWRATITKHDAGPPLGRDGFAGLVALAAGRPCLAIGGVRPEDVGEVIAAGGTGVAVVSGILAADDPERAARAYSDALSDALARRADQRPPL